jgi:hypothetical protein
MPSIDLRMPSGFGADGSGLFEMFHNQVCARVSLRGDRVIVGE